MKLLITSTAPFDFEPPEGVDVVYFDPSQPLEPHMLDADAAVVEGIVGSGLAELARTATQLRWVQALAAGPDGLLRAGFADHVQLTSGRGFHDKTVAEHTVAITLAAALRIPDLVHAQDRREWAHDEFGPWRRLHHPERTSTLIDANVLIWGFGSIAQTMAPIFTALSAKVRGVANSAGVRAGYEVFSEADLPTLLPETDVLVMVLPTAPATENALNAQRLALLKRTALVVNVGRGTTVDEEALAAALHAGTIAGAVLDVARVEPLPADSPLWDAPNLLLTPHMAGGRPVGAGDLIRRNIEHLRRGEPLENLVRR